MLDSAWKEEPWVKKNFLVRLTNENINMLKVGEDLLHDGENVLLIGEVALVADGSALALTLQLEGQFVV